MSRKQNPLSYLQEGGEEFRLDVAIVGPVFPVAQVAIAQGLEQLDDAVLGDSFELSDFDNE